MFHSINFSHDNVALKIVARIKMWTFLDARENNGNLGSLEVENNLHSFFQPDQFSLMLYSEHFNFSFTLLSVLE